MRKQRLPLYVFVMAVTAIAVFIVGIAADIFGEEIKVWILTGFYADSLLFLGITALILLLLIAGAIWVIQQQQPAAPPDMPAVTDTRVNPRAYSQLPDDLADDPDARGFIIAARQQEYAELKAQLLRPPQQTRWQALLYRLSFRRLCRPIHVPVAIITGIGGIGKTTLGRRVCYEGEIKSEYHHGRFYFDAAGIYPQFADNSTAQVLYRFLSRADVSPEVLSNTLGSPPPAPEQVQAWLEQRNPDHNVDIAGNLCSLYRQTLEGRKRLIILDNPPDTMDVSKFAPPAGNALLVITRPGLSHHFSGVKDLHLSKFDDQAAQHLLKHEWPGEGARLVTRINRLSSGIPLVLIVLARTLKHAAETGGFTAAEMLLTELELEHRKGGWLVARFLSRLLPYSGEPNRKTVADVFGLSYQRLTATAQDIFRALALFSGYDFRAEAAIAVGAGDETGFAQLVNRGLVERYQDSRRYFLYDPIAEYARTLLHANADEVRMVKERYLDHFIAYVTDQARSLATVEPAEEVTALVTALRHDLVHIQVCRAMLNDTTPDDLPMTVRRLRLALPTLAIINRATADDQPDQSWFSAGTAGEWEATACAALEQIWAGLDETGRTIFAGVGIFPGPFDLPAAGVILAPVLPTIDRQRLERLVTHGLLQQPAAEQYEIRWPLLQQRARQSFAELSAEMQQTLRQSFARYYAQRAADFFNAESTYAARHARFTQHWPALAQGQAFAASATPPLDTELITYAEKCFWYLDQPRSYDTLTDWLETALAVAQRTDDLPALARLSVNRGIVARQQQQWDAAQDWYQRALDTPGADPDTRANACHGLGIVAYKQAEYMAARNYYTRAIALDPGLAAAYRNRGLAWANGNDRDYGQALADARKALEIDPHFQAAREDIERYQRALDQQSGDSQSDM